MMSDQLLKVISGPPIHNDPLIKDLLLSLDARPDSVCFTYSVIQRTVNSMSPSCKILLGYEAEDFIKGGPDFIFEKTHKKILPDLLSRQNGYAKQIKQPGFDPKSIIVLEFPIVFIHKNGDELPLLVLGMILSYSIQADIDFGVSVMVSYDDNLIGEMNSILRKIKKRHNEIYAHEPFIFNKAALGLVHTTNIRYDAQITPREQEVLALLAKGFSTQEIADQLNVSINTIETHRRKLLDKFDARNVAELIKKASKVFWLE